MTKNHHLILGSVTALLLGPLSAQAQAYTGLAAAPFQDRGVDVFAIDSTGSVEHHYQREPGGDFAGFEQLGNSVTDIAALELADGRYEVFIVDRDHALWHSRQLPDSDAWSAWEQLDNACKQVAVARSANGRVELFVTDTDDVVWHIGRDNDTVDFWPWARLDLQGTQLAAAAADGDGFELAVIGSDRSLWLLRFSGTGEQTADPVNLAGESFDVALARFPDGGHSLLTVGTSDELWERRRGPEQDFSEWQNIGRSAQRIALTTAKGGLELFTSGADGALLSSRLSAADGSWSEPQTIVQPQPLVSELKGRARLIIPSLNVDKGVNVSIGLRFSSDRASAEITSFPSVTTEPFDTPFGNTTSTVSLARSSVGELRRDEGSLRLPVTLHFDQSLNLPIIEEDGDLSVELSTEVADGQRLDRGTGNISLSGSGRFQGQGSTNPLDGQDAQIIVTGQITPLP